MSDEPILNRIVIPKRQPGETIEQQFLAFHEANPHVYDALVQMARDLVRRGRDHLGIGMLFEVLRWSYIKTWSDDFKLNNNYRSRYARLIARTESDLANVFELRELKAA